MLRTVNKDSQLLKGAEKLPNNSSAMGKWLQKYQFALSAHGIELTRPPRGSHKRLWDWRQIVRDDDTSGTLPTEASHEASSPNPLQGNENQLNDTLLSQFSQFL